MVVSMRFVRRVSVIRLMRGVFVVVMLDTVHTPDGFDRRYDKPVDGAARLFQYADHRERLVCVFGARIAKPMAAIKALAYISAGLPRDFGADHGLTFCDIEASFGQFRALQVQIGRLRAHDAKAVKIIAQSEGDNPRYSGVAAKQIDALHRDITGGLIYVKDTGEDEL